MWLKIALFIPRRLRGKLFPELDFDGCNVFWCKEGWPFLVFAGFGCSPKIFKGQNTPFPNDTSSNMLLEKICLLALFCIGLVVQDPSPFKEKAGQNQPSRCQHDVAMELIQHENRGRSQQFCFPQSIASLLVQGLKEWLDVLFCWLPHKMY